MSDEGEWLRRGVEPHFCRLPEGATQGAIWRCSCGRRWRALRTSDSFNGPSWFRWYWPWPR